MSVEQMRKNTLDSIADNPVTVTINRKEKTDDGGGGWVGQGVDLQPQTIRIFVTERKHSEKTDEAGQQRSSQWGLLASYNADIISDDTFTLPGRGTFSVGQVMPVTHAGEVVSKQAMLEEIA